MHSRDSLKKYLEDLSARKPVPGGGSAASLVAAFGVSLMSMVVRYTLGKPSCAKYNKKLRVILVKTEAWRSRLLCLSDADSKAFASGDKDKMVKVPLEVFSISSEALKLCRQLVLISSKGISSDAAVAAALLESACFSSVCNVRINLLGKKGRRFRSLLSGLKKKLVTAQAAREETEVRIGEIIGW